MPTIGPIKTDADYNSVVSRVARLMEMDEEKMPQDLSDELEVLIIILESYEAIHFPRLKPDPISVIEYHMTDRDITSENLESCIGSAKKVTEVLAGKRPLTLKMIRALNRKFSIPIASLTGQWRDELTDNDPKVDWEKFPVSELASNNCFKDRRNPEDYSEELMRELIRDAGGEDSISVPLFRKSNSVRQNSKMDGYALQAWCLYVIAEARNLDIEGKYKQGVVNKDFLRKVALLSNYSDGPLKAKEFLSAKGIALIYAPHLKKLTLMERQ